MEWLKEFLGDELYSQVEAKLKGNDKVKIANLASGEYVSKSKYDDDIKAKNEELKTLTTKVKAFDGVDVAKLQDDVKGWERKYNEDMASKDKDFAKQLYFSQIQFTSNLARSAAIAEFDKKNLEFKDGKFIGADDFIEELKKENPTAFVQETKAKEEGKPDTGFFSSGMPQGKPSTDKDDPVTARFKELNPDIKI